MGFLFSGVFWGVILILIGLSIILQMIFKIHIPVFRIVVAFLLIYAGIRVLVGGSWFQTGQNSVIFEEKDLKTGTGREYSVIFGKAAVDATQPLPDEGEKFEVNTVFGSSVLRISDDVPTRVKVDAVFAGATLPDGNTISFGTYNYVNNAYEKGKAHRFVDANVVFGSMRIEGR